MPVPQTPGVIGGGQIGNTKVDGSLFNTPKGPQGEVHITYPNYPETVVKENQQK